MTNKDAEKAWRKWVRRHPNIEDDEHGAFVDGFSAGHGKALAPFARLLEDLTDPDDCWFDHHGGCQAHGYISLQPGEICPVREAKDLIATLRES